MDKSRVHPTITAHIGTYVVNISSQIIYVPFLSTPPLKFGSQLTKCIFDRYHIWAIWWPVDGMEEIGGRTIFDYGDDVWCLVQCKIVPNYYPLIITSAINRIVFNVSQYCPHEIAESELVAGLLGDDDPLSRAVDTAIDSGGNILLPPSTARMTLTFS